MSTFENLGIQKEVPLAQGTLQYRECGSGTPIVFIHGLLVNGDLWRKVVPILAKNYRCIIPDLPLGSHSTALKADADLTPPGIAKLIANFLEALDLSSVTLVANDTGGAFTQIAITEYPERVGRLVLTNCDAYDNFLPPSLRPLEWLAFIPGFVNLLGQASKSARVGRLVLSMVAKHPIEDRAMRSYTQPLTIDKHVRRDLGKVLRGISPRYTNIAATRFSNFDKPVLLVWASEDSLFPKKYAERLQQAFPHATLHYVEDSYAFISEDQPEQLGQHVETFMESSAHQLTNQQREVQ
jgi:pimeloyl-ACP methyl ester carboxylesterase